jgi:hypothetical protein
MPLKNPTRAEKQAYREQMQRGLGKKLEPLSNKEIKVIRERNPLTNEQREEKRLSGSQNLQYRKDVYGLGSPLNYDDYSEEAFP